MPTSFRPLEIRFQLENEVYYDPLEPPMFDAILAWLLAPFKVPNECEYLRREDTPTDFPLPLAAGECNGYRLWKASALFPADEPLEALRYWRKRAKEKHFELLKSSICTTNGICRDYNVPMPVIKANELVCWCVGDKKSIRKELKRLRYIGKKRSQGVGRISAIDVQPVEYDYSWTKDGLATRWLPDPDGVRRVRVKPPYWNNCDRVPCCEVGAEIK